MQKEFLKNIDTCDIITDSDSDSDSGTDSEYQPSLESNYYEEEYICDDEDLETDDELLSDNDNESGMNESTCVDTTIIEKRLKRSASIHIENDDQDVDTPRLHRKQKIDKKYQDLMVRMSPDEKTYFLSVSQQEREHLMKAYEDLIRCETDKTPLRFRILTAPIPDTTKRQILNKLDTIQSMSEDSSEYHKYYTWINSISRMPIGKYQTLLIQGNTKIREALSHTRAVLDNVVYGHQEAKDHILRILAQWISNPTSTGHCIGIQGPMGIGKTTLIKEGVSRALGIPFGFIALGGSGDASSLEGHSFTYEGSTYGRISEILMKTQVMNPIIFFDELDKISDSPKGEELASILTHITDQTQNQHFTDRYFGEIELDLSKALMVFSFNDESRINPILRDRLTVIRVQGYSPHEKAVIAIEYMLPMILKQYGMTTKDIFISEDIIHKIVEQVSHEDGVRNLRRGLESIISWINMARYIVIAPFSEVVTLPFTVDKVHVDHFLTKDKPPVFCFT